MHKGYPQTCVRDKTSSNLRGLIEVKLVIHTAILSWIHETLYFSESQLYGLKQVGKVFHQRWDATCTQTNDIFQ